MTRMQQPRTAELHCRGLEAWQARDLGRAERLFRAVLTRRPRHADAEHFLGLVAQATGRMRMASRLLEAASRARPRNAVYAFNLGNLRFQQGRHVDALREWERAARLDRRDEDAWRNIGLTCAEQGLLDRAEEAFRRALAINPDAADTCQRLAVVSRRAGRREDGRGWTARARALERDPDALARFGDARAAAGQRDEAIDALGRATRLRPTDASLHCRLAALLVEAGREPDARRACRRALALSPSHVAAGFLADSLEGRTPPAPPAHYVEHLFDRFADVFDEQLVDRLGYRGPVAIWSAVQRVRRADRQAATRLDVLDAGCGTGLAAGLLRPAANRLVGIDLSEGMLRKARARRVYDRLLRGDLAAHLLGVRARYHVVFAADVFIYVGDLGRTMSAARGALRPGGLLAFSIELCDGDAYCLTPTQRYAHSMAYVRRLAGETELTVREARAATLRYEGGVAVPSGVVVLQRLGEAKPRSATCGPSSLPRPSGSSACRCPSP
jgi:predicted TPR repeat methyltransferase/Tfp pilus assembly protein PilF